MACNRSGVDLTKRKWEVNIAHNMQVRSIEARAAGRMLSVVTPELYTNTVIDGVTLEQLIADSPFVGITKTNDTGDFKLGLTYEKGSFQYPGIKIRFLTGRDYPNIPSSKKMDKLMLELGDPIIKRGDFYREGFGEFYIPRPNIAVVWSGLPGQELDRHTLNFVDQGSLYSFANGKMCEDGYANKPDIPTLQIGSRRLQTLPSGIMVHSVAYQGFPTSAHHGEITVPTTLQNPQRLLLATA